MRLTTKILTATNQPVNHKIHKYSGETLLGPRTEVKVFVNDKQVGYMKYSIQENCLYIHRMDNYSIHSDAPFKHVGTLLFEYAFHKSIQAGKEGRLELDAIANSPAAYFHMGLRKKGIGAIWLYKKISDYQVAKSPFIKREIEEDCFYQTLKKDAEAVGRKKGLTSLSFEEVLEYGSYSAWNDDFAERIAKAKISGEKLTEVDSLQCYMHGIMYLPPEMIAAKKLELCQFKPIGSNLFFSAEYARSRLKNPRLIELVNNGKLDSSNAVEIDAKLSDNTKLAPLVDLLLSPLGLKMMRKNYISGWFAIIYFNKSSLEHVISTNGLKLFEHNYIKSMSQLVNLHPSFYPKLFSDIGLKALERGELLMSETGYLKDSSGEPLDSIKFELLLASVAQKENAFSPCN
ncbi:hypothetical protein [Legionella brunensis]|uniref:Uncharacterized protein n=1 Tax=Legionella brunensis TaxID=29422 RepID=A0A0W0STY6_9GAMM|nr:hypothetical protein [Legionella brunensis]KTC86847.1 hypothetical protein Lbru_0076 [Legionella brunensis]